MIASDPKLGVSNINMLPDLSCLNVRMKIPTQGRLGLGERNTARKLLSSQYGIPNSFLRNLISQLEKSMS